MPEFWPTLLLFLGTVGGPILVVAGWRSRGRRRRPDPLAHLDDTTVLETRQLRRAWRNAGRHLPAPAPPPARTVAQYTPTIYDRHGRRVER